MNNKEKIITEIERRIGLFKKERINATPKSAGRISLDGRIAALEEILVFINSLSAEQQNDDLDDEIKLYQLRNPVINHNERSLNEFIKRVATYFANWQKERDSEKILYSHIANYNDAYKDGVEETINKACNWILNNFKCSGYSMPLYYKGVNYHPKDIANDFKKAMEEE